MSEPSLPDDPARWPDDPYELLGVPRNVSPRDLRRAYTRLIRIYKPEQYPHQFRRIRDAYEAVQRLAEFFGATAGEPGASATGGPLKPPVADAPGSPDDDPDALWAGAVSGAAASAYAALVSLCHRRPDRQDLPLRLYWLLALQPELDPDRPPATWLAAALDRAELGGPAAELIQQELDERPSEALAATDRLLESAAPTDRLTDLAVHRWRAAARLRRWGVLRDDLERLRGRVRSWDEASWLRLQMAALDHVAWEGGDPVAGPLLAACRRELDGLSHLAVRFPEAFDRFDYLLAVTAGWRRLCDRSDLPADLVVLLPRAWAEPFAAVRPLLVRVLEQVSVAPQAWLRHFDALERSGSTALPFFGALLSRYQDRRDSPPPVPHAPEDLARLAAEFLEAEGVRLRYAGLRPRLLTFCLREAVGPEHVAAVVPPGRSAGGPVPLATALLNDWPLRTVCWACRLFWA